LAYLLLDKHDAMELFTAFGDALATNKYQLALTLLSKMGVARVQATNAEGQNLFHTLAQFAPSQSHATFHDKFAGAIAEALAAQYGLDPFLADTHGRTALHLAAAWRSYGLVRWLKARAAQTGTLDQLRRRTAKNLLPLHCVFETAGAGGPGAKDAKDVTSEALQALVSTVTELLDGGATIAAKGEAGLAPVVQTVQWLLAANEGHTPPTGTHVAAPSSPVLLLSRDAQTLAKLLELLLGAGKQDVNQVDACGLTALHNICKADSAPVARAFVHLSACATPALDVNRADGRGYTPVHALLTLAGNPWASPENVEILQILLNAGADATIADKSGRTPLEYAARQASGRMYHALADALGAKAGAHKPALHPPELPVEPVLPAPVSVDDDADRVYKDVEVQLAKAAETEAKGPPVDPLSGLKTVATVMYEQEAGAEGDGDNRVYYDVTLSRINSGYGYHGQHLFYRASALHNHVQGLYVLWTRWGSVGEDGQYQRTPFGTRDECVAEFLKVFKSKTGFAWAERATGQPKEGRYKVQPPGGKTLAELQVERLKHIVPAMLPDWPALPASMQFLLRVLTDTRMLTANMVQDRPFALPFGAAHKTAVAEAAKVLGEARELLLRVERLNEEAAKTSLAVDGAVPMAVDGDGEDGEEGESDEGAAAEAAPASGAAVGQIDAINKERTEILATVKKLSEKYFELIPAKRTHVAALGSVEAVDEALSDLSVLQQQNTAGKLLLAAHASIPTMNPFDYILRATRSLVAPLAHDDPAYETLLAYATPVGSVAAFEPVEIFTVAREGEAARFAPYATQANRMLLFHGSSATNVLGILSEGLCCAPPTANIHGHAYGKGVYFADVITKSIGYGHNSGGNPNTNNHIIVFIAEVFLGKVDQGGGHPRDGYDSVFAPNGATSFSSVVTTKTGARIPIGAKGPFFVLCPLPVNL
ncbi:MAG: WGR domain-containing protein, partial [Proteobacteria bacterium]|nr:WGR domain-containing protein [Pseudomonadota bacterium]